MEPKPLKYATQVLGSALPPEDRIVYCENKDIKSAVEWFKKEIRSLPPELSKKDFIIQLAHIIPIAFHDVCVDRSKDVVEDKK